MVTPSSKAARQLASPRPRVLCMWAPPVRSPMAARTWRNSARTCAGLAMPVVSDKPISSTPAATNWSTNQSTSCAGTAPCKVQPKAVDKPTSTRTEGARSRHTATMWRTSWTMSSRLLRTLASEWAALADTGMVSLCTPAAKAASAPWRLGTSAITVRPGSAKAWRTTSATSAICGKSRAGTKEPTSISFTPAACRAAIQRHLSAVAMVRATDCKPSLGPTSLMCTSYMPVLFVNGGADSVTITEHHSARQNNEQGDTP